jgi:deoxycytidylate deaminase
LEKIKKCKVTGPQKELASHSMTDLLPILRYYGIETERQIVLDAVLMCKKHGLLRISLLHILLRLCLRTIAAPLDDSEALIAAHRQTTGALAEVRDTVDRMCSIQGVIFSFLCAGGTKCFRHRWAMQLWPFIRSLDHQKSESIILLLHSCVELATINDRAAAEARQTARHAFAALTEQQDHIRTIVQPAFLETIFSILQKDGTAQILKSQQPVPQGLNIFLQAAAAATRGNQRGSKHGAVLVHNGHAVSTGFNHWIFDYKKKKRVIHAEVHALVNFFKQSNRGVTVSESTATAGTTQVLQSRLNACIRPEGELLSTDAAKEVWSIWIVELSPHGLGYESAHPCPQCNKALMCCGISTAYFSTTAGVRQRRITHNPAMVCESLQIALQSECM